MSSYPLRRHHPGVVKPTSILSASKILTALREGKNYSVVTQQDSLVIMSFDTARKAIDDKAVASQTSHSHVLMSLSATDFKCLHELFDIRLLTPLESNSNTAQHLVGMATVEPCYSSPPRSDIPTNRLLEGMSKLQAQA